MSDPNNSETPDSSGMTPSGGGAADAPSPSETDANTFIHRTQSESGNEGSEVGASNSGSVAVGVMLGPYQIARKLGQGGMGAVFEARHTKLKKTFAVKVLPPEMMKTPAMVARFEREMEAVGALDHPHIVRATDAGEFNGTHFLVMEYVEGTDLSLLVKRDGPLPVDAALEVIRQAALGLQHAHEHGLVHRDIKPSNLLMAEPSRSRSRETSDPNAATLSHPSTAPNARTLTSSATPSSATTFTIKILDLGLARLGGDDSPSGLTSSGQLLGTPDYMAPEQWDDTRSVDARADLYSLGCTLAFLLTGKAPFDNGKQRSVLHIMKAHADAAAPDLTALRPEVSAEVNALFQRLMAKRPEDRFQTAAEVVAALESLKSHRVGWVESSRPTVADAPSGGSRGLDPPYGDSRTSLDAVRASDLSATTDIARETGIPVAERQGYVDAPTTSILAPRTSSRTADGKGSTGQSTRTAIRQVFVGLLIMLPILFGRQISQWVTPLIWGEIPVLPIVERAAGLRFDGKDDYVEVTQLNWAYPQFTIEAFVTSQAGSDNGNIVTLAGGKSDSWEMMGLYDSGQANPGARQSGAQIGGRNGFKNVVAPLTTGVRQHRVLVYDGFHLHYYVNGLWQGKRKLAANEAMQWKFTRLRFGSGHDGKKFFEGQIDQVRISKVARYTDDFPPVTSVASDDMTLALYNFDENEGELLKDASGHGRDARIVGATWVRAGVVATQKGAQSGWQGWPVDAPKPAIAPFNADEARQHQEAWAKYLNVPVEYENSLGMKFRLIPPGEFTMGMTKEEAEAVAAHVPGYWTAGTLSSTPEHRVRLTQPYYLGTYEVTQEQYEKVIGDNPSGFSASGQYKDKIAGEDTKQHPVEMVSFIDAAEFCIALGKQEQLKPVYFSANGAITLIPGDGYRLPTEAEWEYACRAGTNTAWFHGEQESTLGTVAWFNVNSGGTTHSVGQLRANPFGLYDVHGNVWEWCQDWFDPQAYAKRGAEPTVDPRGPDAGSDRALRGGVWLHDASVCRSDLRVAVGPSVRYPNDGVRLSVSVDAVRQALKLTGPELPKAAADKPDPSGAKPSVNAGGWQPVAVGQSPFDKLDPAAIPAEERFEWQPKELVAVIGNHARRHWSGCGVWISPDGKYATSSTGNQTTIVWDMSTQTPLGEFAFASPSFSEDSNSLYLHEGPNPGVIDLTKLPLELKSLTIKIPEPGVWLQHTRLENGRTLVAREYKGENGILLDVSADPPVVSGTISCSQYDGSAVFRWSASGTAVYRNKEGQFRRVEIKDAKFVNDRELAIGDGKGNLKAISADGKRVVLRSAGTVFEIWDIGRELPKKALEINAAIAGECVLSPDGRWFTTSYNHTQLWRIDGSESKLVGWLDQTGEGDGSVAFSQDGNRAIVGNRLGFVRFWNLSGDTPQELSPPNLAQAFRPPGAFTRPQLDPRTGRFMAEVYGTPKSGFTSRHQLWDFGAATPRPHPTPDAWLDSNSLGRFVSLPNQRWLNLKVSHGSEWHEVYGVRDGTWQTEGLPFGKLSPLSTVSPDGSWLFAFSGTKPGEYAIEGWDMREPPAKKWTLPFDATQPIRPGNSQILSSHDGSVFAVAHGDDSGGELTLFRHHGDRAEKFGAIPFKFNIAGVRAALSPDGGWLVHYSEATGGPVVIADIRTGQAQELARKRLGYVRWLTFSPDGQRVAYAGNSGDIFRVGVLDAKTLAPLYEWKSPGNIDWLDFAPDARHLITLNGNHTIYVLRLPTNATGQ